MKMLNQKATKIFASLLKLINGTDYLKLSSEGYMPLTMEKLTHDPIKTAFGNAHLYSLFHFYEQNGDLMRDPEMVFIVVDRRVSETDYQDLLIFPQLYRQDGLGIYQESAVFDETTLTHFHAKWQQQHAEFAGIWLTNIQSQGFINNSL